MTLPLVLPIDGFGPLAAWLAVICSSIAVLVSVITYSLTAKARKADVTIGIWKTWASKEYRTYGVDTIAAIDRAKAAAPPGELASMTKLLADPVALQAIGSIEHFLSELAAIKDAGLLDRRLYNGLFRRSALMWQVLLAGFDRDECNCFQEADLQHTFKILVGKGGDRDRFGHLLASQRARD